jgi:hypothetical protein
MAQLLERHGFEPRGRLFAQPRTHGGLLVDVLVRTRPGDSVAKASLGSSAFVRACRLSRGQSLLAERLALRLGFGTRIMLGFRAGSGSMTKAHVETVRRVQRDLSAVAYDGWVFQDAGGVVVLDLRSRFARRLAPVFLLAGYERDTHPPASSEGYLLSERFPTPDRAPLVGHIAAGQMLQLPHLLRSRSSGAAARAVRAAHDVCDRYYLLRRSSGTIPSPGEAIRTLLPNARVVLDEFAWYDGAGLDLLHRFPGV